MWPQACHLLLSRTSCLESHRPPSSSLHNPCVSETTSGGVGGGDEDEDEEAVCSALGRAMIIHFNCFLFSSEACDTDPLTVNVRVALAWMW